MSITVTITVTVYCDARWVDCRGSVSREGDRVTVLRNLRLQGWKIGTKEVLCPSCRHKENS